MTPNINNTYRPLALSSFLVYVSRKSEASDGISVCLVVALITLLIKPKLVGSNVLNITAGPWTYRITDNTDGLCKRISLMYRNRLSIIFRFQVN